MSPGVLLVVMALASYRVWRLVGEDTWPPSEAFRTWLERKHEHHDKWANAEPLTLTTLQRSRHVQAARRWGVVYELITCPWCLGSWVAGAVVLAVDVVYGLEAPVLQWGAVACLVGIIGKVGE